MDVSNTYDMGMTADQTCILECFEANKNSRMPKSEIAGYVCPFSDPDNVIKEVDEMVKHDLLSETDEGVSITQKGIEIYNYLDFYIAPAND